MRLGPQEDAETRRGGVVATTESSGIDTVIDALGHERRRILIDTLYEDGGGPFSEVVAGVSRRAYGEDYDSDERKRIYVSLYQNHVPRLCKSGVVVFEGTGNDKRIYPGPGFRETKAALSAVRSAVVGGRRRRVRPLSEMLSEG